MNAPSLSYIRRDVMVTSLLLGGVILLAAFRPHQSQTEVEVKLAGALNSMSGSELVPQGNPYKPTPLIAINRATDKGWDISVATQNFMQGETDGGNNPHHLAVGYPYLLIDGVKIGRLYGPVYHVPKFTDGQHLISVFFEFPRGGLYRLFGKPIGRSLRVTVQGADITTSPL